VPCGGYYRKGGCRAMLSREDPNPTEGHTGRALTCGEAVPAAIW
jgi:hypothetical protein